MGNQCNGNSKNQTIEQQSENQQTPIKIPNKVKSYDSQLQDNGLSEQNKQNGIIQNDKDHPHKCTPIVLKSLGLFPRTPVPALYDREVFDRVNSVLQKNGFTPENTLFGTSICPDEINHEWGDLANIFFSHWGQVFHMGGLSGIPFVGKTGFNAFAHHVPNDGNILVLFGPHISINPDGQIGFYHRIGQNSDSTACGAAIGAYNTLNNNGKFEENHYDVQFNFIVNSIKPKLDEINSDSNPLIQLSQVIYDVIQDFMLNIIHTNFGINGQLALLGGIEINTPDFMDDCFIPFYFKIHQNSQILIDLIGDLQEIDDEKKFTDLQP